jgi:hypothetical protein
MLHYYKYIHGFFSKKPSINNALVIYKPIQTSLIVQNKYIDIRHVQMTHIQHTQQKTEGNYLPHYTLIKLLLLKHR